MSTPSARSAQRTSKRRQPKLHNRCCARRVTILSTYTVCGRPPRSSAYITSDVPSAGTTASSSCIANKAEYTCPIRTRPGSSKMPLSITRPVTAATPSTATVPEGGRSTIKSGIWRGKASSKLKQVTAPPFFFCCVHWILSLRNSCNCIS